MYLAFPSSRGTGPRATVTLRSRGTGPRATSRRAFYRGNKPRATVKKTPLLHVGRGPVPRQAIGHANTRGETRSHARVAGEGPALRFLKVSFIFRRARACPSPVSGFYHLPYPYRAGSPEPELQRWTRCLPVFACLPRQDTYRNGVMKHPQLTMPDTFRLQDAYP